jgi:hypothetical protein
VMLIAWWKKDCLLNWSYGMEFKEFVIASVYIDDINNVVYTERYIMKDKLNIYIFVLCELIHA